MTTWLVCLALCCAAPVAEDGKRLNIQADDDPTRVVVRYRIPPDKLDEWRAATAKDAPTDPRKWLSLRLMVDGATVYESDRLGPPVFGSHEVRDGYVLFRPQFALARDASYLARVQQPSDALGQFATHCVYDVPPLAPREPTKVENVLPGTDQLPANLLKFEIYFSRPMRHGAEVFSRIRLLDQSGKEIPSPWRDIELWSPNSPCLSLYIHPGRIKQGVNLREEFGPVLVPGQTYTLVIDAAMRDAAGAPLGKEFRKTFKAGPELHKKIELAAWKVTAPVAGTREPIVIAFDRPIDAFGIFRFLRIIDPAGNPLDYSTNRTPHHWLSQEWSPKQPWQKGIYLIKVDPQLTDVAGNTPHTVFDRDLEDRTHDPTEGPIERTFEIR